MAWLRNCFKPHSAKPYPGSLKPGHPSLSRAAELLSMRLLDLWFGAGRILDAELQTPSNSQGQQSPRTPTALSSRVARPAPGNQRKLSLRFRVCSFPRVVTRDQDALQSAGRRIPALQELADRCWPEQKPHAAAATSALGPRADRIYLEVRTLAA